jgi:hypothetical protein
MRSTGYFLEKCTWPLDLGNTSDPKGGTVLRERRRPVVKKITGRRNNPV